MSNAKIWTRLKQLSPRERNAVAISCSLLLILAFFSLKGCNSSGVPPKTGLPPAVTPQPPHGTLKISENVEKLVSVSLSEGKIFYEMEETKETGPLVLNSDREMKLPVGKGRLLTIWELESDGQNSKSSDGDQFFFRDPGFIIRQDLPTPHDMNILAPWKYPKFPAVTGAWSVWTGKFHRNPGSKDESSAINYKLKITTLNEESVLNDESVDPPLCRWLRVEVETSSALAPTVTETAFLLVDVKEWEANQEFVVRRGWIQATSEDIRTELETYASADSLKVDSEQLPPLRQITLKFDRDRDVIARKAIELEAPFPEDRLSLLDVLSLVMDADLKGASKLSGAMRDKLSGLDVSYHKDVFKVDGTFNCLKVESQIVTDDLQFELLRNDVVVPFSLAFVDIKHPLLEASLKLSKYNFPKTNLPIDPVDEAQLAGAADRLNALPRKTRFDLAAIPKEDGVQVDYTGVFTGSGPNSGISYSATVSTLATEPRDGRQCRWLKVEVTTTGSSEAIKEAAIVLVDPADYELTHKTSILDGWLIYHGKDKEYVLPFDLDGDMQQTDEDLQMLEFRLPEKRLSIHDVLALLFNAQLAQSPSKFITLRGGIERQIESSAGRIMTRQELKLTDGPTIPGKVWTFKGTEGEPLNYTFKRSERIPFSVFSMDLTYGPVKLSTKLNSYVISKKAPAAFNIAEWENRVKETQVQITTWQKAHPNYHFWTIKQKSDAGAIEEVRLLAEWAGYGKQQGKAIKRTFFLKPYDVVSTNSLTRLVRDGQIQFPDDAALSSDCDEWIAEGRHWIAPAKPSQYFPERIAPEKQPDGILVKINGQGPDERIPFKSLSKEDQDWVNRVHANSLKNPE